MQYRTLPLLAGLLLAGCAADLDAPAPRGNEVTSYWFHDVDPARSAELPPQK